MSFFESKKKKVAKSCIYGHRWEYFTEDASKKRRCKDCSVKEMRIQIIKETWIRD